MKKIVVLISGSGSNLQAIIDAVQAKEIDGVITRVISNKADAYGLIRAFKAGIPNTCIDHKQYDSREAFDEVLKEAIDIEAPDIIVLAGFMRILTDEFVEYFHGKLINIHPSLLPKFKGLNTHQRAIEEKETEHGASVHFVTPALDDGPVIVQACVPILENDTVELLQKKVHRVEHIIYPLALKWMCENKIQYDDTGVSFEGKLLGESGIRKSFS